MTITSSINSCPRDQWLHIFSYLDLKDLCVVARVCKKWEEYARKDCLWKPEASRLEVSPMLEGRVKVQVFQARNDSYLSESKLLNRLKVEIFHPIPIFKTVAKACIFDVTTPLVSIKYLSHRDKESFLFVFKFSRDRFRFLKESDAANRKIEGASLEELSALHEKAVYKKTIKGGGNADFSISEKRRFLERPSTDYRIISYKVEMSFLMNVKNLFFPKNPYPEIKFN